jgi:hypothetical protein
MNAEITENVQTSIRPGSDVDTYYYGETNSQKQAYSCIVNNKFRQQFTNLNGGTSQFTISPYNGVSDIILYFKLQSCADCSGAMLPQGWGYSLIRQVSVRYGSSAQYFFTGEQMYLESMFDCEDSRKRDQLASLGGNALTNAELRAAVNPEAFVYLKLPHNSPRADGKPLPFPSDLLVQPIIITVELNSPSSLVTNGGIFVAQVGGVTPSGFPPGLADAQLQVKQEMMQDSADLLARRVDMNSHAYTYPLMYYPQQEVAINLPQGLTQNVNLTGFRAGEVQRILLWLTKNSDIAQNGSHSWLPISNIQLTYNGEIFFKTDSTSANIWNLVCDTKEPAVNIYDQDGAGGWSSVLASYVDIPFSQVCVPYDKEIKLLHGKPILNAIVNLTFTIPTGNATDYTLHAVYLYNASLLCSRGSAEYVF